MPGSPSGKACSAALCSSSVTARTSGVAAAAGSSPNEPVRRVRAAGPTEVRSPSIGSTWSRTSSTSTTSSRLPASVSCTTAIDATRRTDSSSAARAAGSVIRRACSRSSAATVCRLFFTRWWISRIVASLVSSARSRRRTSVTSRTSTSAPASPPGACSGRARTSIVAVRPSTSIGSGNRPATAAAMPAATASPATRSAEAPAGELGQVGADEVAGDADPPVGRQRVGAGVGRPGPRRPGGPGRRRPAGSSRRPAASAAGRCPAETMRQRSAAMSR